MLRRTHWPALAVGLAVLLGGCGGGGTGSSTTASNPTTTTAGAATRSAHGTTWLCFPGRASDPCASGLATTSIDATGKRTLSSPAVAAKPAIDCFYVYPTVSTEDRGNSDLAIQLPEIFAAQAQADRFSQVCRVYAPMYRQITSRGLTTPSLHAKPLVAYNSVLAAWKDYLAHENDGRGVVLIGHSQGAYILKHLIKTVIDRSPAERKLLVSAILLGGQVLAPNGPHDTGDFVHVPPCASASEIGCVIAYSSFGDVPPAHARFGRDASPSTHVLCVNPAAPGSTARTPVTALFPSALLQLAGAKAASQIAVSTPWIAFPGLYTVQCRRQGTASWLQVTSTHVAGDTRPLVRPLFGFGWGLHGTDVNIALADLVQVVSVQAKAFARSG